MDEELESGQCCGTSDLRDGNMHDGSALYAYVSVPVKAIGQAGKTRFF